MSTRITVSQVAEILKSHRDIPPATLRAVVEEMNAAANPEGEDEVAPPKAKTQFVILANADRSFGWVLTLPEDASPAIILDRVKAAAHDFNASKRGRLLPVKSVGEALESTGRKFFKNQDVAVKTKLPVAIVVTDNQLGEPPTV